MEEYTTTGMEKKKKIIIISDSLNIVKSKSSRVEFTKLTGVEALSLLKDASIFKYVPLDIETTGLDYKKETVLTIQFRISVYDTDPVCVLDCRNLTKPVIVEILKLLNVSCFLGHNIGFDLKFIYHNYGFLPESVQDTMLCEKIITNSKFSHYRGLKALVKKYLSIDIDKTAVLGFIGKGPTTPISSKEYFYAAEDVNYLNIIVEKQNAKLKEENLLLVAQLECRLIKVYMLMEMHGMPFLKDTFEVVREKYRERKEKTFKDLDDYVLKTKKYAAYLKKNVTIDMFTGIPERIVDINYNSNQQLVEILKTVEKLKLGKLNKSTQEISDSVDNASLKKHTKNTFVKLLLEYREVASIFSKYCDTFLEDFYDAENKCIHTRYLTLGTATGRVSSKDPNLQNIPSTDEFRGCFGYPDDSPYTLLIADYSGQELRIIGAGSGDPVFIKAFQTGEDLHSTVASLIFNVPVSKTENKNLRNVAKTINFGLAYGATEKKLSEITGMSLKESAQAIQSYFKIFPKIQKFLQRLGNLAVSTNVSRTFAPYNRARYYDENEPGHAIRREGMNLPIQGTGADMVKEATLLLYTELLKTYSLEDVAIIHQVHDEIILKCKKEYVEDVIEIVKECMEEPGKKYTSDFVFEVDIKANNLWIK